MEAIPNASIHRWNFFDGSSGPTQKVTASSRSTANTQHAVTPPTSMIAAAQRNFRSTEFEQRQREPTDNRHANFSAVIE
jgi:hypothetical protein